MRQRRTKAEAERARELNRRCHILVEGAQCLLTRSMMQEEFQRERSYSLVHPREADTFAFEQAARTRAVACVLASKALRDAIKDSAELTELMLGPPPPSVDGIDYSAPREPKHRAAARKTIELLGLSPPPYP